MHWLLGHTGFGAQFAHGGLNGFAVESFGVFFRFRRASIGEDAEAAFGLVVFIALIFYYAHAMKRLERKYHLED